MTRDTISKIGAASGRFGQYAVSRDQNGHFAQSRGLIEQSPEAVGLRDIALQGIDAVDQGNRKSRLALALRILDESAQQALRAAFGVV